MEKKFDGMYFLPGEEEDDMNLSYFTFEGSMANGKKVDSKSPVGDIWQVAFFVQNEEGYPVYKESFEGIFISPETYIKNLCGTGLYGCIVRKTDKSIKWFEDYLNIVKNNVTILKLK